jgi:putative tryptophan/tyrosine transport system substrate-binding protein
MKRRNLILGLLVVAAMGTAHAQQRGKVHRIAVVHPSHPVATLTETSPSPVIAAIFTELSRSGYVEGKNILIERYSGEGRAAHYPDLARDVVRRNPDLIMAIAEISPSISRPPPPQFRSSQSPGISSRGASSRA